MTGTYGEVVSGYGTAVAIGVVLLLLALIAVTGEATTHRRRRRRAGRAEAASATGSERSVDASDLPGNAMAEEARAVRERLAAAIDAGTYRQWMEELAHRPSPAGTHHARRAGAPSRRGEGAERSR